MAPSARRSDHVAAGLELLPFIAPILVALWLAVGAELLLIAALILSLASGLGWRRLGYLYTAMFVFAVRGFVFFLLLSWGLAQGITEDMNAYSFPEEARAHSGDVILVGAAAFFVLTTLASAAGVLAASGRRRATAPKARGIA